MPQFSKVTIYGADDVTAMVSISTDPSSDGLPHTNLAGFSERLDQWLKHGGLTVTADSTTLSPKNNQTAELITPAAAGDYITAPILVGDSNGRSFMVSVWLRADTPRTVRFGMLKNGDAAPGAVFELDAAVTTVWQRFSILVTGTVVTTQYYMYIQSITTATPFHAWGADMKEQLTLTDYIPTPTAAAVTMPGVFPYLQDESLVYGESKINFAEGSAGIGQFGFKLLDKRTVATDQTSGFFTAFLADTGGRGQILGHRVVWERQQLGGSGAYITQFDGIADDCQLDPNLVEYHIPCRDVRERERTNRIFTKMNQLTSLVPNGPVAGWGSVPGTALKLIPPVTPLRGQFWRDPNIPGTAGRVKCLATQFDLMITGSRYQALQNFGALTQGSGITGGDTSLAFRNVIIWWRAYPGGGAWTVLQNMPAVVGTDYSMNNIFPLGIGTFQGAENRSFVPKNNKELANFLVNMTGPGIPAHLQNIEFMVLANGQPTPDAPIYWEGNLGQLTKEIYDGTWSNYNPGIRYDAAAMATFVSKSINGAALIDAPVENGLQWVQENTYKPQGWAPSVPPETGLVTPIQYNLPTVTEPLLSLTDSLVKEDAKWELAKDELINSVTFQYEAMFIADSKYLTNFADKLGINANNVEPPAQRLGRLPIYYNEIAVNSQALLGAKDLSYKPETIKLFGILTPDGLDTRMWPDIGAKLAKDRTKEVLDRFTFAGQRLTLSARRTGTGVAQAKMGNWVLAGISWLPDYVSDKRGLNRIMQIVAVNDDDKVFRKFVLSDAGPNVVPSSAPVIGAITQANGVIDIPFTSIPANVFANVDYALSTLEPASDSGLWISAGRTSVATDHITVGPLPPGTSVWIRAVGQEPGKRRSSFTASQNIIVTNNPYILGFQVTYDADGHVRANWTNSTSTLGVQVAYVVHDATVDPPAFTNTLDAAAGPGQIQLPVIPGFGQAVTVKITPYPGFAAGAVSGSAGPSTNSLTSRNFGNFSDVTMPVVQEQTSQTSTLGTLTLVITDPQLRVTKVEFATQQSSGAWSAWVQDSVLPYATSVAIAAGNQSKIGYRITGYDATGTLNVLIQSEVLFTSTTLGVPQPPYLYLTRSSTTPPSISQETVTVSGGLGANGVGPFQWRYRIHADYAAAPAWPAFSASPALPNDITITRGLKWHKILDVQVQDGSGNMIEDTYTIGSKMDAINDNGVIDDTVGMSSTARPFKRSIDPTSEVVSIPARGFIDQGGVDVNLRLTGVYRGGGYEPVTNLFKRGTDSATDVVTTTTRTFVDPNAATQVDASGRIVGVYRLGVYEPVNNLVKVGDTLGNVVATTLTVNSGAGRFDRLAQILSVIQGNTLIWGHSNSDYWNALGAQNSSGFPYIAFAAFQAAGDTWKRSGSTTYPAALMYSSTTGLLGFYNNNALGAADAAVAFAPVWTASKDGVFTVTSNMIAGGAVFGNAFFSARTGGVEKAYYGVAQATDNLVTGSVTGDACLRLVTAGGRFLFSIDNGVSACMTVSSTGLHIYSANYVQFDAAFGAGLVGLYDPTKYRLIYAIGGSYVPPLDGNTLTGFYGVFFAYDQTTTYKNVTGYNLGHGIGIANNGTPTAYVGLGIWTSGVIRADSHVYILGQAFQNGIDVAKVIATTGAIATSDAAPASGAGTIKLRVA